MTTFYVDFEGGNDGNAGTSFATRWKTITNGATAARIAPGDEIRVMASPDPTSIGSATWTGSSRPEAVSIASSTNASPIVITTATAHGFTTGQVVSVAGHTVNTSANGIWKVGTVISSTQFQILKLDGSNTIAYGAGGATGAVTNVTNCVVTVGAGLTKNITLCGGLNEKTNWVAATNVTVTQNTTNFKEGYSSVQIAINSTFTTGKAASGFISPALDLSAYQQVSFWIRQTSGTVATAGQAYLALCSDTGGNTVVHQCPVPALGALNVWVPVTVNLGTNLSNSIGSVALYIATDVGAQTFVLDNVIACKAASSADSINLQSLISKSDGTGDEAWYAIQSINDTTVMLANANSDTSTSINIRGYSGATGTVTTYKRETIKTTVATSNAAIVSALNDNGTAGSLISYTGGWNRTDMSTQTGQTWLDGLNGNGYGITPSAAGTGSYNYIDRLNVCRYNVGLYLAYAGLNAFSVGNTYITACTNGINGNNSTVTNCSYGNLWINNNNSSNITIGGTGNYITNIKNGSNGTSNNISIQNSDSLHIGSVISNNAGSSGISHSSGKNTVVDTATLNNSSSGVSQSSGPLYINGGSSAGNSTASFAVTGGSSLYCNNFTTSDTVEVSFTNPNAVVYANRLDNTDNNNWVFQPYGTVNQQTSIVDSPATTAWLMRPTSASASATCPILLKLGTVVCAAGSLVTVTARMRRDNTGLTMRLACPGGQISGVSSDVTSDMTAAADTWETVTITFTPTKPGGVDIYAYAFGGTTYSGYVCNLTASQA